MDNVAVADEVVVTEAVADTEVISEDEVGVDRAEVLVETVADHDVVRSPRSLMSNVQCV